MLKKHPLLWAIWISLLLHLFLFFIFTSSNLLIWPFKSNQKLIEPDITVKKSPLVFEIVETVEESKPPSAETSRLSDKTARQQDLRNTKPVGEASNISPATPARMPASYLSVTDQAYTQQSLKQTIESIEETEDVPGKYKKPSEQYARDFSVNALLGQKTPAAKPARPKSSTHFSETRAEETGMFQLNTYAWDFAPYLIQLKNKIERNLYPPPAFNRLGIQGSHLIRFTILPDGGLTDLQLIKKEGSNSLVETSTKALIVSAPFMPLPENFPEEKLIITAQFNYILFANR